MDSARIDTLTATIDQLQAEFDAHARLLDVLWCAVIALSVSTGLLLYKLSQS